MSGDTYVPQDGFAATGAPDAGGYQLNVDPSSRIRYARRAPRP